VTAGSAGKYVSEANQLCAQILPAVVRFKPDLILVSAGFDAHRKDEINYAYIGVTEKDYEWLTDQIVQVANRCAACRESCTAHGRSSCIPATASDLLCAKSGTV